MLDRSGTRGHAPTGVMGCIATGLFEVLSVHALSPLAEFETVAPVADDENTPPPEAVACYLLSDESWKADEEKTLPRFKSF